MKLANAINHLIKDFGYNIFKEDTIINFLNDYSAFEEVKAHKHVFTILFKTAVISKICFCAQNNQNAAKIIEQAKQDLDLVYGIKTSVIIDAINDIIDGFNLNLNHLTHIKDDFKDNISSANVHNNLEKSDSEEDSKHFKFKGVAIYGTVDKISNVLNKQGFTFESKDSSCHTLQGTFAGIQNVRILIQNNEFINEVNNIIVVTQSENNWWSLKPIYEDLKQKLINKYGSPAFYLEEFLYPYEEGDGYELTAVENGNVRFSSQWELPLGRIFLFITQTFEIAISYTDKLGSIKEEEAKTKMAEEDL